MAGHNHQILLKKNYNIIMKVVKLNFLRPFTLRQHSKTSRNTKQFITTKRIIVQDYVIEKLVALLDLK